VSKRFVTDQSWRLVVVIAISDSNLHPTVKPLYPYLSGFKFIIEMCISTGPTAAAGAAVTTTTLICPKSHAHRFRDPDAHRPHLLRIAAACLLINLMALIVLLCWIHLLQSTLSPVNKQRRKL
jgi:hypothetical protein